jgi:hypothetical protein
MTSELLGTTGSPDERRVAVEDYIQTIKRFEGLHEDWDSYGARRISARARKAAIKFLQSFPGHPDSIPSGVVAPTSDGGVAFRWELCERAKELLLVFCDDRIEYAVTHEMKLVQHGTLGNLSEVHSEVIKPHLFGR